MSRPRLVGDLQTPVSAFLRLGHGRPPAFLLESVEGGAVRGRYSILGLAPDLLWRVRDGQAEINRTPEVPDAFVAVPGSPLDALRALLAESAIPIPDHLPPMAAGVFGSLGYEIVRSIEHLPDPRPVRADVPDALLMRPGVVVVFDAVKDEITIVTPVRPSQDLDADTAWEAACARLGRVVGDLEAPMELAVSGVAGIAATAVSNTAPEAYREMVARAKEYIAAGDIFQVVLSQRFEAPFDLPPFALYRALRRINPAPFLFFLDFGAFALAGSSPEILVRVRDGKVTVRPIAGTRPRGATPAEDRRLEQELLADEKECAEHLMLLDLGRNDVGRVATIGSVAVTDRFAIERYSQVMHIVSNVEGMLDPRHDAIDALAAGFPAGTVSGAPKVRAMQIIDELEREKRGIYAGAVGYFSSAGDMDTCIVLRTALVKDGRMFVQPAPAFVADSDPASEQRECEAKARALFRAAEEAVRFATAGR